MRILYVITQADGGGAQKYVLALAKHFGGMIAAGSEAGKLFDDARKAGLTVFELKHLKRNINPWHDLLAVWEIRQLLKDCEPDIVHLNSTKAGVLGSFASIGTKAKAAPRTGQRSWTGTRVVFTAHGFIFNEPLGFGLKNFYLALEKVASGYRDFIITVSDADRKSALKNKLISPNKIQTIHNGIGPIDFLPRDEARKQLGLPLGKKIMGVIANDYKTKGLDIVAKLKPVFGTMIAVIGKVSGDKQSSQTIKYLGYKPNAAIYLKAFDGTMIPSKKEGFPYVALEAMQAGSAILATDVGGNKEALGDAGIIVEPNSPEALQKIIELEFINDNKIKELSEKSLARSKLFTEEKMFAETKKIYDLLLKNS